MVTLTTGCSASAQPTPLATRIGAPDNARDFGDVLVWPANPDSPDHYLFLPTSLSVAQNMVEAPNVGMFDAGGVGFFFATVTWQLTPERQELLRRQLTVDDAPPPHLSLVPVNVAAAKVITLADDGTQTVIREQLPSPHPPYTAMLQFAADPAARPLIMSALEGRSKRLLVCYDVSRTAHEERRFTLTGQFPASAATDTLEDALARGDLSLTPEPDSADLRAQVLAQAAAVQLLNRGNTTVEVTLSIPHRFDFQISLDVGRRMAAHQPIHDPLPPE